RDTDHADVVRAARARGVGIGKCGEIERSGARHALAPAGDIGALAWRKHVARLRGRCGVAGDDVDAVHTHHRQHATGSIVAYAYRIFIAGPADHVTASLVKIDGQHAALGAIEDLNGRLRRWADDMRAAVRRRAGGERHHRDQRHRYPSMPHCPLLWRAPDAPRSVLTEPGSQWG